MPTPIPHTIRISERARRVAIRLNLKKGTVEVVVPKKIARVYGKQKVVALLEKKRAWIEKHLQKAGKKEECDMRRRIGPITPCAKRAHYEQYRGAALLLILERIEHFNTQYRFAYNNVTIKNTTSRWGSCSEHKNLNFSYKLLFLPEHLRDYIVVHELCHLKHLNHSPAFWALVAQALPNYNTLRKELREWRLD
jgi:predicted metal-dependent hydrolase